MEIAHSSETTFRKAKSFVFSRQLTHRLLHYFSAFQSKLLGLEILHLCLHLPFLLPSLSYAMQIFNPSTIVLEKEKLFPWHFLQAKTVRMKL